MLGASGCWGVLALSACTGDDTGDTTSLSGATPDSDGGPDSGDVDSSGGTATDTTTSSGGGTGSSGGSSTVAVDDTGSSSAGDTDSTTDDGGSSSGSTTGAMDIIGCADGEREGFIDMAAYADIAGCSGGWDVPGVLNTTDPACDRAAGDDALNFVGRGCTVADLCAEGWHVCESAVEVDDRSPNGCVGSTEDTQVNLFFSTRQSGVGQSACSAGANDFHGCGNLGATGLDAGCAPLDRTSNDLCTSLPAPWSCAGSNMMEANQVVKPGPANGGVLCCRDA